MRNKTLSAILLGSTIAFSSCGDEDNKSNKEQFPKEKILTISAKDYCENIGKNINSYQLIGVHGQEFNSMYLKIESMQIPEGTEVIVDYQIGRFSVSATALIPKNK